MTCDSGTLDLNPGLTHVKKLIFLNNSTRSQRLKEIRDMKWNYKVGGRGKSQPAEFPNTSQRPNSTGFWPAHTLESVLAFFCSFFDDFLLFVDRFDDFLLFSVEGGKFSFQVALGNLPSSVIVTDVTGCRGSDVR